MEAKKTNIARALRQAGLTQEAVAKKLGVSRQAVQQWASGKGLRQDNLERLAELLRIPIDQLLNGTLTERPYRAVNSELPEDGWVRVPVYAIECACHDPVTGNQANSMEIARSIDFSAEFLRSLPGVVGTRNMHIVTANGDSMEPTISNRALCIVDSSQTRISKDGIFCLRAEDQLFIKRVQRNIDGTLTLISDNESYPVQVIDKPTLENVTVVGAVVYVFSGKEV